MYPYTDKFISDSNNLDFLRENMMGPNAMRLAEEMASHLNIRPGMRVLDLGCGRGLSTLYLVKEHGAQVFAADLWISPTDKYERFLALGIDERYVVTEAEREAVLKTDFSSLSPLRLALFPGGSIPKTR